MLRFAPSPTGDMHIDDLRVAILNYLVAEQKNDKFLVRIEDIDTESNIEGKDTEIMMILEKFALKHSSVFHQSEHLNLYQTLALHLLKEEKAFVCKCSDEELKSDRDIAKTTDEDYYSGRCENLTQEEYSTLKKSAEPFVIRLKEPTGNSFVIVKSDGLPSYDFACATDDMMSNINFIIRAEKYMSHTPRQIHIKNLLGYDNETHYKHIPAILNKEESSTVKWLFEQGFVPDAILNYLLLLGNDNTPKEIFTLPEAIQWFDIDKMSNSSVKFDMQKLRFINREHLNMMDDKQLSTLFGFADTDIGKLAKIYLEECSTINELKEKIRPIFKAKDFNGKWGEQMQTIATIIANAPAFETFDHLKAYISKESGIEDKMLSNPLRHLLTGTGNGPELSKIYPFIKSYILEVAS
jgi:glutamyl-tRNA synthetase